MAKLYFRYGVVSSAKTLELLAAAYNYQSTGKRRIIVKPKTDTRWDTSKVISRAGPEATVDVFLGSDEKIAEEFLENTKCILVDEAQFLTPKTIEYLFEIAALKGIPVICYGLRTDFKGELFEGSKRLMELADSIEEVKQICSSENCEKKATFNLKRVDGKAIFSGASVDVGEGAVEKYLPVCKCCYIKAKKE